MHPFKNFLGALGDLVVKNESPENHKQNLNALKTIS
jgi:hypothetical protein